MCSARREVLLSKVLSRLYPPTADIQTLPSENETPETGTGEKPKEVRQPPVPELADHEKSNRSQVKVYTVSLPPDDYITSPQSDPKPSTTEESDLEEDQPVVIRKRRRRKKKRPTPDGGQNSQQTTSSRTSEGGKINKNKKRKLQRKRQKDRLKAEGLWTGGRRCQSDVHLAKDNTMKQSDDQTEEEQRKKREDLLDFLQATQELYFSDGTSRCADSAMVEQILEILDQIKSGTAPFSEVKLLHHLKTLLLLQDIERLNNSLDSFKEQSSMPFDHIKALCALFDYWITNILPMKTKLLKQ